MLMKGAASATAQAKGAVQGARRAARAFEARASASLPHFADWLQSRAGPMGDVLQLLNLNAHARAHTQVVAGCEPLLPALRSMEGSFGGRLCAMLGLTC